MQNINKKLYFFFKYPNLLQAGTVNVIFLYTEMFQQSQLQITFPFQPEENTAIWATISGNAILNRSLVCLNIQNQNQDWSQVRASCIMYAYSVLKQAYRGIHQNEYLSIKCEKE